MSVLNVAAYLFVPIDDPASVADWVRGVCAAQGVMGSVLVAREGINLFLAGAEGSVDEVLATLRADPRFAALTEKRSFSDAVPFRRLQVKVKPEIITFKQDVTPPTVARAPAVSPQTLAKWLDQGHDDDGREVVLVDTRNDEELVYGTFAGAVRLGIRVFTALPEAIDAVAPRLQGKTVVTFCTGGIRCEKAAPYLSERGIERVYQLDGGILGYFERVGGAHYQGGCFVFDERISLQPDLSPTPGAARLVTRASRSG
jgi:UPF0176 protein